MPTSMDRLLAADAVTRLRAHDVTLFSDDSDVQAIVSNRLGWTALAAESPSAMAHVKRLVHKVSTDVVDDVVLLGMGGSSLASLVIADVVGSPDARLHVLDTVSPTTIAATLEAIYPARTLYVVASKSGGTIEPNSLYAVFRAHADALLGQEAAGGRFIAVTDPGSSLESLAVEHGFAGVVNAPVDVGGRFSALTVFGLVPASLIGVDANRLLASAAAMEKSCDEPAADNPAAQLAAFICDAHALGRDKLTIVASPPLSSFGLWVEQLVAESLGKQGTGVVPVVELAHGVPTGYGADRAIVVVRTADDDALEDWAANYARDAPVHEIVLSDEHDLGAEFVRWEHAIALSGFLLSVNPFDEPNVAEAKAATTSVLNGSATAPAAQVEDGKTSVTFAGALIAPTHEECSTITSIAHALSTVKRGDYLAVLAFLPDDDAVLVPLRSAVPLVAEALGVAVCLEVGPRYLHSTGQLHKGGPNTGVFLMITNRDDEDMAVPGQQWGLRSLHRAQAEGDLIALSAHDRRVLRVDAPDATHATAAAVARALMSAAGVVED